MKKPNYFLERKLSGIFASKIQQNANFLDIFPEILWQKCIFFLRRFTFPENFSWVCFVTALALLFERKPSGIFAN
jgi:hypothetical protein